MANGFFITGTDTEIGKTFAAVKLIQAWQQSGRSVLAMKPVASGCTVDAQGQWHNEDVEQLVAATGQIDRDLMNPYRFLPPISPHIAAKMAGVSISLELITQRYQALSLQADDVIVEAAGGWFSPLSDKLFMSDMAQALQLPVILVVGMRLGCINHALLTLRAIQESQLPLAGWVANQIIPNQTAYNENIAMLKMHIDAPLLMEIPYQFTD